MQPATKELYYEKIGKAILLISWLHLPMFALTAYLFKTEYSIALGLATFFLLPQTFYFWKKPKSATHLYLFSFVVMCFSGILIHLGKGMIEMHFHVFVFIPITALFGLRMAPIIAAGTIAVHHIAFYFLLPASLFNYDASFSIVILHAAFVIIETGIAIYVCERLRDFLNKEEFVETKLTSINCSYQTQGENLKGVAGELAHQSREQSDLAQRTSSAVHEIKSISDMNYKQVQNSAELIAQTDSKIAEGKEVIQEGKNNVEEMNATIKEMIQEFEHINKEFYQLEEIMGVVSDKTKLINDIVFQTKLLSFNASVEAARAGEHGKGFAVVAEEIGNLAHNSGTAANEINLIIDNSQKKMEEMIKLITQGKEKISSSSEEISIKTRENTEQSLDLFNDIKEKSNHLRDVMSNLINSTTEQNQGIEDIANAVIKIDELIQKANSISEENLHSSNNIEENNILLGEFIQSFKKAG